MDQVGKIAITVSLQPVESHLWNLQSVKHPMRAKWDAGEARLKQMEMLNGEKMGLKSRGAGSRFC